MLQQAEWYQKHKGMGIVTLQIVTQTEWKYAAHCLLACLPACICLRVASTPTEKTVHKQQRGFCVASMRSFAFACPGLSAGRSYMQKKTLVVDTAAILHMGGVLEMWENVIPPPSQHLTRISVWNRTYRLQVFFNPAVIRAYVQAAPPCVHSGHLFEFKPALSSMPMRHLQGQVFFFWF